MENVITEKYAIYHDDCMNVISQMPDNSIDLSVYSPPFAGLYKYSSSESDFSNNTTREGFLQQYEFLIKELSRVTKPGRINAVHCQDIVESVVSHDLWDLPHEIIELHKKYGFVHKNRITVWKEPLKVRMRTMVKSLMHKMIVEDSTQCFTAIPDYVLIFVKKGENEVPVTHPHGLKEYHGSTPILPNIIQAFNNANGTNFNEGQLWDHLNEAHYDHKDPNNKLSHYIWQRYASSVWDDVRIDHVLPFKDSKDPDDEKHVHPLQLDVIERLVELYSNKGEVVLTPFLGVGSEVYGAVKNDRKGIGIELKESYFKQAIMNLSDIKKETHRKQKELDF